MEIEMQAEKMTVMSNGADEIAVSVELGKRTFIDVVKMAINAGDITLNEISD